ncbi:MAG: twin arginine-targeting protein translocase TatC [Dehalococcoidia bacterium CG2_30_46_19]|nr:MAG: twin arginine-targeting protein translocase TatC [Dehalococcoidia bacterium CG2_30_46_19]
MGQDKKLSITEHLLELRSRLIKSVIALCVCIGISIPLAHYVFDILKSRAPGIDLVFIDVTEMLGTYMKVVFYCGIALSLPYLIYQLVRFLSPAMTDKEKRYLYFSMPLVVLLFVAGVCFAYFIFLPPALNILLHFGGDIARPMIDVSSYVSVLVRLLLAVGLVFEMPLVITLLAKLGVVSPQKLAKGRKWAVLAAFVLGAVITPTVDPVNQTLIAAPIIVLYELSIWLAKLVYPRKAVAPSPASNE